MMRVKMDHTAHTAALYGEMRAFHNAMDPISQDSVQAIRYPVGFVDPLTGALDPRQPIYNAPELIQWIEDHRTYPHSRAPVDVRRLFDQIDAVHWRDLRTLRFVNGEVVSLPCNYHSVTRRMLEDARARMQPPPAAATDERSIAFRRNMSLFTYVNPRPPPDPSWLREYWLIHRYNRAQEESIPIRRPRDSFVGFAHIADERRHQFRREMAERLGRAPPEYNRYVFDYWVKHPILPTDSQDTRDEYFRNMPNRVQAWPTFQAHLEQQRREILGQ
jgi:hypothetical protein